MLSRKRKLEEVIIVTFQGLVIQLTSLQVLGNNPTSPIRNIHFCLWPLKILFCIHSTIYPNKAFYWCKIETMKTCPINHIYIIQTNFARVKTKNHVIQLCNIERKKRVHLGKTFNSAWPLNPPLLDNFVEKNGGDDDEDYHVKRRITCTTRMDSTCMCWLDILWQTIIDNFANQLQNSKVLFINHKTSLAH